MYPNDDVSDDLKAPRDNWILNSRKVVMLSLISSLSTFLFKKIKRSIRVASLYARARAGTFSLSDFIAYL